MARRNRIVVEDGVYHITARVAHRAFLLADPATKDLIVDWLYGIADFCGVDVLAWSILDNHMHLEVRVPPVPERYWITEGTVPASAARSLRPAECRAPRWTPDVADDPVVITPAGDVPSEEAVRKSVADGVPLVRLPRPMTGFTMSDDELVERLQRLYHNHSRGAEFVARRWKRMRLAGRHEEVEAEKEAFCRRMYNVSLFMKDLKQRISQYFNTKLGHSGQLWDGRFYSGLVEDDSVARTFVTAYIDWNAPKAGLVAHPSGWRWSSYAVANGSGSYSARARKGYELALACPWPEARARLETIFTVKLPDGYDPSVNTMCYLETGPDGRERFIPLTLPQLVKSGAKRLFRGGYFARSVAFVRETEKKLPKRFPGTSGRLVEVLSRLDWNLPLAA